jgi:hypothetical protein
MVAAGKPQQRALVACMRMLLTILNVMVRTSQQWSTCIAPIPARHSRQLLTHSAAASESR